VLLIESSTCTQSEKLSRNSLQVDIAKTSIANSIIAVTAIEENEDNLRFVVL
jgi:hypothetical protein